LKQVVLAILIVAAALPGRAAEREVGDAAFLFAYSMKPGMADEFEAGYRRHLAWHAQHHDSLTWLGWFVFSGPRLGTFVDGAFGIAPRAFDARVDPAGDGEDAERNVTVFADPTSRYLYRLRRDLGVSARLEGGKPAAMQLVAWVTLRPGGVDPFEQAVRKLPSSHQKLLDYSVYERVAGGDQPAFLVVAQLDAWGQLDDPGRDPIRLLLREAGDAITRTEAEVWQYRADLSYYPGR
jgi:hypothetical protein